MTKAAILFSAPSVPHAVPAFPSARPKPWSWPGKRSASGEVMSRIMADKPYYDLSGGGLSLSGGEPLLQADFCAELAKRCSFEGIRTLVDTSACVPYSRFEAVRPYVREYYVDLKCPDEAAYRRHTGGSLITVLDNLHRLSDDGADITVRIPIIPHVNDTPEACAHMARHLDGIAVKAVHLLPFHKLGLSKISGARPDLSICGGPELFSRGSAPSAPRIFILSGIHCRMNRRRTSPCPMRKPPCSKGRSNRLKFASIPCSHRKKDGTPGPYRLRRLRHGRPYPRRPAAGCISVHHRPRIRGPGTRYP